MLLLIDGPHHVGKTTLVERTCSGFPQPKNKQPEKLAEDFRDWVTRYAFSDDIAVFDHFTLFTHPVKVATAKEERFFREYNIEEISRFCDWADGQIRQSVAAGKTLIIHASLPEHMLPGQEEERREFYKVFEAYPHVFYDWTSPLTVLDALRAIGEFTHFA